MSRYAGLHAMAGLAAAFLVGAPSGALSGTASHAWSHSATDTIASRFAPPPGYVRVPAAGGSFADWLRRLPVKPGRPPVHLHDGRLKTNQAAHLAVIDIDVGEKDLQQCADAVIRLRAEYLFGTGQTDRICFDFTSGDRACYSRWIQGYRPRVSGSRVTWVRSAEPGGSHAELLRYLETVFMYAGTYSLRKELQPVPRVEEARIGDVFIQGGFPGHAVLIADMAIHRASGAKVFLLVQSFMPAQELHVLRAPRGSGTGPWYRLDFGDRLTTPEWTFTRSDLRRFPGGS